MTTSFGTFAAARAVAIQIDGKIVVAGSPDSTPQDKFALARYGTDGTLDSPFGGDGRVTTAFGSDAQAAAAALQANGKIVVAGTAFPSSGGTKFALARYLA